MVSKGDKALFSLSETFKSKASIPSPFSSIKQADVFSVTLNKF